MKTIYQPFAAAGFIGMLALGVSVGCEEQNNADPPTQMPETNDPATDPNADPNADPNTIIPPEDNPYNNNTTPPSPGN